MKRFLKWLLGLFVVALAAFFIFMPGIAERDRNKVVPTTAKVSARAQALHKTLSIVDLHSDTLMWKRDMLQHSDQGHVDLPRLTAGNVALQVFSSVTKTPKNQNYDGNGADSDSITLLAFGQLQPPRTWTSLLERSLYHAQKLDRAAKADNDLLIIRTVADVNGLMARRKIKGPTQVGALLSIEGLQNLEGKRENLDVLFKAGFRMAGFAHFFDNDVAGSMHGLKKGGLTPLGRQIFRDMEAKGMIIDIAHASHAAVAEMLAIATKPVVSSHGGVQATCKVNRNLTDEEVRGVAKTGGVIGIGYWDGAICSTDPAAIARAIKHVRDLVGIDHVGLGSDFDGATTVPFDTAGLAHVTQALIDAGFTDEEIAKVMGGNVLRVLSQTLPGR
jgi:microsomal dipeptidase-like Zn-dependent dipeptidase